MDDVFEIISTPAGSQTGKCITCLAEVKKDSHLHGFIYYLAPEPLKGDICILKNDGFIHISANNNPGWKIDESIFKESESRRINDALYWLPVVERKFTHAFSDSYEVTHKVKTDTSIDYENTERSGQQDISLFQNNVFFSLENTGSDRLTIDDIAINGKSWWSIEGILKDIGIDAEKDDDYEKLLRIWDFVRKNVSCGRTYNHIFKRPMTGISLVEFFNYLGSGACGTYSSVLVLLCAALGIKARRGSLSDGSHIISQVLLGDRDTIIDAFYGPDREGEGVRGCYFRNQDNVLASYRELCDDHYLVHRAGRLNIGEVASLLGYHDTFQTEWTGSYTETKVIRISLYPGESVTWFMHPTKTEKDNSLRQLGNFRFSKNLSCGRFLAENLLVENNRVISRGLGSLYCRMEFPFPLCAFDLRISLAKGSIKINIRTESGEYFKEYTCHPEDTTSGISISLDDRMNEGVFNGGTDCIEISIISDENASYIIDEISCGFYAYGKSLMNLREKENTCSVRIADNSGTKKIKIKHGFLELPGIPLPKAPRISYDVCRFFINSKDSDKLLYDYIITEKPDSLIPVSPKHQEITSKNIISIEDDGILVPGREYYMKMRSINSIGIISPWCRPAGFVYHALPAPVFNHVKYLPDGIELHWFPVASNENDVSYDIFGSSEKGFIPSMVPYDVWVKRVDDPAVSSRYPGNHIASTNETSIFIPFDITKESFPSHFRIRASTEEHSGPAGEMISLTTPYIFKSSVKPRVQAGNEYSCFVRTILSLGSLHFNRLPDNPIYTSFLKREIPFYELEGNPSWLQIRPEDGYLHGSPGVDDRGRCDFYIHCTTNLGRSTTEVFIEVV